MTIICDGHPVLVEFISCNHYMTICHRGDCRVEWDEKKEAYYLYNIYSYHMHYYDRAQFHKKLKIYNGGFGGCYVNCNGHRCYMNNLVTKEQKEEITGIKEIYPNA